MAVGAVVAAIIAAGVAIGTTVAANADTEDAKAEARNLGAQARKDTLAESQRQYGLQKEGMEMSRKGLGFQQREASLGRAERKEERAYNRFQNRADDFVNLMNRDKDLKNNLFNIWGGR